MLCAIKFAQISKFFDRANGIELFMVQSFRNRRGCPFLSDCCVAEGVRSSLTVVSPRVSVPLENKKSAHKKSGRNKLN
nr:MAG TPA: hypothetical protein [Caudoviricetes sp.]